MQLPRLQPPKVCCLYWVLVLYCRSDGDRHTATVTTMRQVHWFHVNISLYTSCAT